VQFDEVWADVVAAASHWFFAYCLAYRFTFRKSTFHKWELGMIHGYGRVSSKQQDYALQVEALKAAGCERIHAEKASGKSTDGRPELKRLIKSLKPGDVVVVTRLDRLARSSRDLLNILHEIEQAGASFKSIADAWADTTTPHGKLMLTVLGGLAEFERSLILARTEAGIAKAREQGKQFGRPERLDAGQKRKIAVRIAKGDASMADLAAEYGVGVATIWRAVQPEIAAA
jgi:DNA invertase Pin-like site-specific DNA recombinase